MLFYMFLPLQCSLRCIWIQFKANSGTCDQVNFYMCSPVSQITICLRTLYNLYSTQHLVVPCTGTFFALLASSKSCNLLLDDDVQYVIIGTVLNGNVMMLS